MSWFSDIGKSINKAVKFTEKIANPVNLAGAALGKKTIVGKIVNSVAKSGNDTLKPVELTIHATNKLVTGVGSKEIKEDVAGIKKQAGIAIKAVPALVKGGPAAGIGAAVVGNFQEYTAPIVLEALAAKDRAYESQTKPVAVSAPAYIQPQEVITNVHHEEDFLTHVFHWLQGKE